MVRRNIGLELIVVLVVGGLLTLVPISGRSAKTIKPVTLPPPSQCPSDATTVAAEEPPDRLYEELKEYLFDSHPSRSAIEDDQGFNFQPNDPRLLMNVESLIVTLPDPLRSKLADDFDLFMESVQEAAGTAEYSLRRFFLPWLPEGGVVGNRPEEFLLKRIERAEGQPGIMLFSKHRGADLLVVFIVGETPRFGIDKGAMLNALRRAAALPETIYALIHPHGGKIGKDSPSELRILGPTFSGSQDSLEFALLKWKSESESAGHGIRVISGDATAIDKTRFPTGIVFASTMLPVDLQIRLLAEWLDLEPANTVTLAEGDTSFGAKVFEAVSSAFPTPSPTPTAPKTSSGAPTVIPKPLSFKFPIHISDLARASKTLANAPNSTTNPDLSVKHQNLPLADEPASAVGDVVPLFSSGETNALELTISELMETIREQKIHFAILGATDAHDVDYLIRRMHDCCAATRVIVLESELLYLHSEINPDLEGTIVASTYPLMSQNQLWTPTRDDHRDVFQFSSSSAEGVYNATLALLGKPDSMVEYGDPHDPKATAPALWLTVVGHNDVWPLTARSTLDSNRKASDYLVPVKPRRDNSDIFRDVLEVDVPGPFELLSLAISLSCIAIWLMMFGALFENRNARFVRGFVPSKLRLFFGDAVFEKHRPMRRHYLLIFSVTLQVIFLFMAWILVLPDIAALHRGSRILSEGFDPTELVRFASLYVCAIAALGLGSGVTVGLSWVAFQPPNRSKVPAWVKWLSFAFACAIIGLGCWLAYRMEEPEFVFLRSATLNDGASPLVSFLFLSLGALIIVAGKLRRLNLDEARQLDCEFFSFNALSFAGVREEENRVRTLVERQLASVWIVCPLLLMLYFAADQELLSQHSVDKTFAWLFFSAGAAIYVGVACVLLRFVTVWIAIRTLLRRLYWHASRGSYVSLRRQLPKGDTTVVNMLSGDPSATALSVSLEQGNILARGVPALPGRWAPPAHSDVRLMVSSRVLAILLERAGRALTRAFRAEAEGKNDLAIRRHKEAQAKMSSVTELVGWIFEPVWSTDFAPFSRDRIEAHPAAIAASEIFIGARVADYLRQVLPHLGNLAFTATSVVILMLFATSCYPFPAQDRLVWFNWGFVLLTVGLSGFVFFSMNRDRVMSMLAGTTPGKVTLNTTFVLQILAHGILPLIALLGAAFPTSLARLASWFVSFGNSAG